MRAGRLAAVAAFGLVAVVGVAGCGSGSESVDSSAGAPQRVAEGGAGSGAPPVGDADGAGGLAGTTGSKNQSQGNQSQGGQPQPGAQSQPASAAQRHVVRSAQLSLETTDVYPAARKVHEVGARFGGYVADEKTDDRGASIELRVVSDDLDEALTALSEVGKVLSRGQRAEDVTEQVVDVQARLASQRASVERVRALLANATAIGEIVQIEAELTRRQADLESLEQRAAALSSQTELATVTVQLHKRGTATADPDDATGFLDGLTAGWRVFLDATQVLLTVLGALLPFLIALAIPVSVIMWVLRRRRPAAAPVAPASPTASAGN